MRKLFLFGRPVGQLNVHGKYIAARDCARVSFRFTRAKVAAMRQNGTTRFGLVRGNNIRDQLTVTALPLSVGRLPGCSDAISPGSLVWITLAHVYTQATRLAFVRPYTKSSPRVYSYTCPATWYSVNSWQTGADAPKQLSVRSRTSHSAVPLVYIRESVVEYRRAPRAWTCNHGSTHRIAVFLVTRHSWDTLSPRCLLSDARTSRLFRLDPCCSETRRDEGYRFALEDLRADPWQRTG